MQIVKVASLTPRGAASETPPHTEAYDLIARITRNIKRHDLPRASILLTRLMNNSTANDVATVAVFIRFAEFHIRRGKVTDKVYTLVLDRAWSALTDLRAGVRSERTQVTALAALRHELSIDKRAVLVSTPVPAEDVVEEVDEAPQKKSVDAIFLQSIQRTDNQSLGFGESGSIVRSVALLHTIVPELELRKITTLYGIQKLAGMYLMASHARLIGVAMDGFEDLEDASTEAARQLRIFNRAEAKSSGVEYEFAPMDPVNCVDHYYWLLFPSAFMRTCRLAKFGKWDFTEKPKASDVRYED